MNVEKPGKKGFLSLDVIDADMNETETIMTREAIADGLGKLFNLGDGEYEHTRTMKIRISPTAIEAYFIYIYATNICTYERMDPAERKCVMPGTPEVQSAFLFPVGACCSCGCTSDINEKFHSHTQLLAMEYVDMGRAGCADAGNFTPDYDEVISIIENECLGDCFHYQCQSCGSQYKYETLTQKTIDSLTDRPFGYLDTDVVQVNEDPKDFFDEHDLDNGVAFVLFNNHYTSRLQ